MTQLITDGQPFKTLTSLTGTKLDRPWKFFSQGTIGAYPGFENEDRDYVPITAVLVALR